MGHADQRLRELELERTLMPQGEQRLEPFSCAAARRLAHAFKPVRVAHVHSIDDHVALWSPLNLLDPRDKVRVRVTTYCAYVRTSITVQGVADAVRVSPKQAHQQLVALRHRGVLLPTGVLRGTSVVGRGGRRLVWEWLDDAP